MTFADRLSVWFFLLLALVAWLAPWVRQRVERRRGIAPPARLPRQDPTRWVRRDPDLLPPAGDWCGCCGRPCDPGAIWCALCAAHVTGKGPWHEQTWYATHRGEDCPFSATWGDPVEEVRMMPGAERRDPGDENDPVAEGLGIPGSPVIKRAYPSRSTPLELLPRAEREVWREALKAGL